MSPALILLLTTTMGANLEDVAKLYEEQTYVHTGGEYKEEPFKWRLLKPEKIEEGKKYPVVLFLHGAGERGNDNVLQLKYFGELMATDENRKQFPCFLIAPQCRAGKNWDSQRYEEKGKTPPPAQPSQQAQVALGILDEVLKKYPVDPQRVYLTGLSMGGYGSWDILVRYPDKFTAAVPICGGGDISQAAKLTKLPIWCVHGSADKAVPVERSRKMIEAIKAAGGNPKYTEYEGVDHVESWERGYSNAEGIVAWLFQQKKSDAPADKPAEKPTSDKSAAEKPATDKPAEKAVEKPAEK